MPRYNLKSPFHKWPEGRLADEAMFAHIIYPVYISYNSMSDSAMYVKKLLIMTVVLLMAARITSCIISIWPAKMHLMCEMISMGLIATAPRLTKSEAVNRIQSIVRDKQIQLCRHQWHEQGVKESGYETTGQRYGRHSSGAKSKVCMNSAQWAQNLVCDQMRSPATF